MRLPRSDSHRSWPLYVLAAPATVAVWSGWVGLGEKTGFGKVHPLPGIADHFSLNTAITLPVGVEAYAAYALGAWLSKKPLSDTTRAFARASAIGALVLGALGQIAYHLLEVSRHTHAPIVITMLVACLPVAVLGMGATLAHLIHRDGATEPNEIQVPQLAFETHPVTGQQTGSADRSETYPAVGSEPRSATQAPIGSETKSGDPDAGRSETRTAPAKRTQTSTRGSGPAKARQTASETPTEDQDHLLERARSVDSAHLQEHGRHISAENLRKALRIGKPAALALVQQIRGTHLDVAK